MVIYCDTLAIRISTAIIRSRAMVSAWFSSEKPRTYTDTICGANAKITKLTKKDISAVVARAVPASLSPEPFVSLEPYTGIKATAIVPPRMPAMTVGIAHAAT